MSTPCSECRFDGNICEGTGDPRSCWVISESPIDRRSLVDSGLPEDFYLTSVIKCWLPRGVKPEPDEVKRCLPKLQAEIDKHKPKHVLILGATVLKALTRKAKITEAIGQIIELNGIKYVPCYAPNYVLRDPSKEPEYKSALKRFMEVVKGTFHQKTDLQYEVIARHNLSQFLADFQSCSEFVYDLETSGLDHYSPDSYINCIGFYLDIGKAYVLPIKKTPTLPEDAQERLIKQLTEMGKRAIGQNAKFDGLWIRQKYGVNFHLHFDTMLAHHLLDENSPHGLKELARHYLNAPDYDLTTSEKKGNVEADKLFKYCAWDCYYTFQLKQIFAKELFKDLALRKLFYKMVMPASRMMEAVEQRGHFVDLPKLESTRTDLQTKLKVAEAKLNEYAGRSVNWNSTKQVAEVLFTDLKLVPKVFTDKGAPSTSEGALAELDSHPIKALLQEYRGYQKFLSTYIEGWSEFMVGPYLYLSTKLHGTVTGRWSSRLHQVPRDGAVRNLITAPPGWTFVQADLSQAELRVAAIVSRDAELIRCYANGVDVHWKTTIGTLRLSQNPELIRAGWNTVAGHYGEPASSLTDMLDKLEAMGPDAALEQWKGWKERRKQSKGINFGYIYGMGAKKFTEFAKITYDWTVSLPEAEGIRESFFSTYSSLPSWHERQRQLVRIDGQVRNLAGRLRRLPGIWSSDREVKAESERQSINSPVQGFIGDYKVMAMLSVYEAFTPDQLVIKGEVHDSVLMWVKDDYLEEALPKIKHVMEHPPLVEELTIELPVPLTVDIEIGRWGAGKSYKPS